MWTLFAAGWWGGTWHLHRRPGFAMIRHGVAHMDLSPLESPRAAILTVLHQHSSDGILVTQVHGPPGREVIARMTAGALRPEPVTIPINGISCHTRDYTLLLRVRGGLAGQPTPGQVLSCRVTAGWKEVGAGGGGQKRNVCRYANALRILLCWTVRAPVWKWGESAKQWGGPHPSMQMEPLERRMRA